MSIFERLFGKLAAFTAAALFLLGGSAATAQTFNVGDHVEARPEGSDWYPCVVFVGAPNYRVRCTNIDGTTHDYVVPGNRLRPDTGQAAAQMKKEWDARFPVGSRVDAAPDGEQNGYHPCTVLSVKGNGVHVGIYHLRCDYPNGPLEVNVGARDYIRAATTATAAQAAKQKAAIDEQNRPPANIRSGKYTCAAFSGGRLEFRPSLDMRIVGPFTYVGVDGKSGTYTYDEESGLVNFRGGALNGTQARYLGLYGGQFKMMNAGHYANVDCNYSQHQ